MTKDDKCGAVVLINVDDYMKEAKRQLDNMEFYTKLKVIPTAIYNGIVNKTICDFTKDKLLPEYIVDNVFTYYQRYTKVTTRADQLMPQTHQLHLLRNLLTSNLNQLYKS